MNAKILIKPIGIAFLAFLISSTLTAPKLSIFYKLEHVLSEKKIDINAEKATNFFLFLKLNDLKLNSPTNKILASKDSYFFTSYIYSGYYLASPKLSDALKALLPMELDSIYASNSIFAPSTINIRVSGAFGQIHANVDAKNGTIKAKLELSKDFENESANTSVKNALMMKFKQTEEGLIYESTI